MASITEQILARIGTILAGVGGITTVTREQQAPFSRDAAPAVNFYPGEEIVEPFGDAFSKRQMQIEIEIYTRGDPASQAADPIRVAIHAALFASAPLRALIVKMRDTAAKWETHEADQTSGVLTMTYDFIYLTSLSDLTIAAS